MPLTAEAPSLEAVRAEFSITAKYSVRPLIAADVRRLEWHGGPDLRSFYDGMWTGHQRGDLCVLVADFHDFPLGQIVIHWSGKPAHLDFPDQQSLRVHPALRGMGVGSRLIETSERYVARRGFPAVGLSVGLENPGAKRLYERLGYATIGEPYEDKWSFIDAQGQEVWKSEIVLDLVKNLI